MDSAVALFSNPKVFYVGIYVFIWGIHSMLIKLSQTVGPSGVKVYPYDISLMTLNTEAVKLLLSVLYLGLRPEGKGFRHGFRTLQQHIHLAKWFAIPAVIYLAANILAFMNLRLVSVPTYRILINVRVLFSGLLLQHFFAKMLTGKQWLSLCLLILGCCIEQLASFNLAGGGVTALILISAQAFCSSLGGVYFQWLLQRNTPEQQNIQEIGLVEKNIFLYSWMCVMNSFFIVAFDPEVLSPERFSRNFDMSLMPILLFGAFGGFTTSLLLKHLDVVAKEFANALEMLFVYGLSWYLLDTPLSLYIVAAIGLVVTAVVTYNQEETIKAAAAEKAKQQPEAIALQTIAVIASGKDQPTPDSSDGGAAGSAPSSAPAGSVNPSALGHSNGATVSSARTDSDGPASPSTAARVAYVASNAGRNEKSA